MGAMADGGKATVADAAEAHYGPSQQIEGLGEVFVFFGTGNGGGALFHDTCQSVVARFGEQAQPTLIIGAAEEHWCPALGAGIGVG